MVSPLDAVVIITDVVAVAVVIPMPLALRPDEVIPAGERVPPTEV